MAVGNILGGIAIQTVVLVALDAFGVRGPRPLTCRAASLVLVLEAALVVVVLAIVIAGTQLPSTLIAWRVTHAAVLLFAGLDRRPATHAARDGPCPSTNPGNPPTARNSPAAQRHHQRAQGHPAGTSSTTAAIAFGVAAAVTLLAGVVLERSGDALADHIGLSGVLFGATILAAATSLPELSTGLTSVSNGEYQLAMSDILGGNPFQPVLVLMATLLPGNAVLPQAQRTDIYLTALAIVLTLIYAAGRLFRPQRRIVGMGADSVAVIAVYTVGVAGLFQGPRRLTRVGSAAGRTCPAPQQHRRVPSVRQQAADTVRPAPRCATEKRWSCE